MANENKNTKKLVSSDDDDATAELQELTLQEVLARSVADAELEDDADTFEFERMPGRRSSGDVKVVSAELESRQDRIGRLQFDLEQLRSRFNGLRSEVEARQEITDDLRRELAESEEQLAARSKLLQQRDRTIKELKAEIRERESSAHERRTELKTLGEDRDRLSERLTAIQTELEALSEQQSMPAKAEPESVDTPPPNGALADLGSRNTELSAQLSRTEAYADEIRVQLTDRISMTEALEQELTHVRLELAESRKQRDDLMQQLDTRIEDNRALAEQIGSMQSRRNDELRALKLDLTASQEALTEAELAKQQLGANLDDAREYRGRIEAMLTEADARYQKQIAELEGKLERLSERHAASEAKLRAKSEAVTTLLAELSNRNDARPPGEAVVAEANPERGNDRVNRMLIGRIDNQELRFPLFKKRLTIGRTQQNDIQLNVPYISRRHAVILTEGETTRVVDWGSKNGVYVNSRRVTEHFLASGDRLTIGNAEFRYEERTRRDG